MRKASFYFIALISVTCVLLSGPNSVWAQTYDSNNEATGLWLDGASWAGGNAPGTVDVNGAIINVNGYITRDGDVSFLNGTDLHVRSGDTLVINGNFTLKNNCNVFVEAGALFVVMGNYTANNNLFTENQGIIAINGTVDAKNGTTTTNNGEIYTNDPDANAELGLTEGAPDATQPISNLDNNGDTGDQNLFDFIEGGGGTSGTLPVELAYFEVNLLENHVRLNWATLSEINFSYFEILHSVDGKNYEVIGTVKGSGTTNSLKSYEFWDHDPAVGNNYYLLKAVDLDGTVEKKGVEIVYIKGSLDEAKVFPNPVSNGKIVVSNLNFKEGAVSVAIYHASGKLLLTKTLEDYNTTLELGKELPKGVYVLMLRQREMETRKAIIIQ